MSQYGNATEPPASGTHENDAPAEVGTMLAVVAPVPLQSAVANVVIFHVAHVDMSGKATGDGSGEALGVG